MPKIGDDELGVGGCGKRREERTLAEKDEFLKLPPLGVEGNSLRLPKNSG